MTHPPYETIVWKFCRSRSMESVHCHTHCHLPESYTYRYVLDSRNRALIVSLSREFIGNAVCFIQNLSSTPPYPLRRPHSLPSHRFTLFRQRWIENKLARHVSRHNNRALSGMIKFSTARLTEFPTTREENRPRGRGREREGGRGCKIQREERSVAFIIAVSTDFSPDFFPEPGFQSRIALNDATGCVKARFYGIRGCDTSFNEFGRKIVSTSLLFAPDFSVCLLRAQVWCLKRGCKLASKISGSLTKQF